MRSSADRHATFAVGKFKPGLSLSLSFTISFNHEHL